MKAKSIIIPAVALVAGFVLGSVVDFPPTTGNGQGNISKVDKFHKSIVSPQLSAYQEKLKNDSTELRKTVVSLTVLSSRMSEFASLVDIAVEAASNQPELQSEVDELKSLKTLSQNAANAGSVAMASFDNLMYGSSNANGINYEQASQNLTLAYLMVGRQMQVGKDYVAAVDRFLRNKKADDYMDLAVSRDLWASYCAGEAYLSKDKDEIKYWNESETILPADGLADEIRIRGVEGLSAEYELDQQVFRALGADTYGAAEVEKYGAATVDMYGAAEVEKYGAATVDMYGAAEVDKYGAATVDMYGIVSAENFCVQISEMYGISENMGACLQNGFEGVLSREKLTNEVMDFMGIKSAENYGIESQEMYGILDPR